ncbi:serine hydrolase domain-containing protein [Hymenobacter chitinivorans]|uniref:CubicO group peptidase (Beta-lactamase class C family) n=1 Tax=Hymenobacter chitinivorans DSM 11115 TaxID=1121954 RepID=A0A2M9BSV0_9BACT|nr:serine hydrolase domain-containing protein [Hymenobacter chitinivorans]PJJ61026.1 CubicO group peptidase (beta-lactamase class C family) [Hymenobacter chitinivorans DSM 11115]
MLHSYRAAGALLAVLALLNSTGAQAQTPQFTSYAQFNDTLVARFNRGDFKGIEAFGSEALKKLEPAGSMAALLGKQQAKTGRIVSSRGLPGRNTQREFAWQGERQNLRVRLVSSAPGVIDDYFISDFLAQPNARATPLATDNRRRTPLDQAVDRAATLYMQHPDAAGLSIGVYWQGQSYFYNYGEVTKGSGRLPTPATYYDLGSVAKTFVTTLLAQAVVDKKVQLTDDIRKYLPGQYPNLEFEGQPVRLVDLATHTSGLPSTARQYSKEKKARLDKEYADLGVRIAHYNRYTADSLLQDMHAFQLSTKPGVVYRYQNLDVLILQLVLERVYQQPYEQLITQYVQSRFGMKDTKRVLSAPELPRFATGYDETLRAQTHANYTGYWGGATMNSTPADLLTYVRANLAEKEPAVKLAHQPAWGTRIGLGWMLDTDPDGQRRIFHNGHSIGFNTRCVLYPGQQTGIVVLVNEAISQDRVTEMEEYLKQQLAQLPAPGSKPAKAVGRR